MMRMGTSGIGGVFVLLVVNPVLAKGVNPILHALDHPFPSQVSATGTTVTSTYTFTNNLPWTFKNPFLVTQTLCPKGAANTGCHLAADEVSTDDRCSGKKLEPQESCTYSISLTSKTAGRKVIGVSYSGYDHNVVVVNPPLSTVAVKPADVFIKGSVMTALPASMIPNQNASYQFKFTNEGTVKATSVTVTSSAPGFWTTCSNQLSPGSFCLLSGNYTATTPPPSAQTVIGTFNFAEGGPVSVTTGTTVSTPTSGVVGTAEPPLGEPLPSDTLENTDYTVTFNFTNYEPSPITFTELITVNSIALPSPVFSINPGGNGCVSGTLAHGDNCSITGTFHSSMTGTYTIDAQLLGTGGSPNSNIATTTTTVHADVVISQVGVDYNPNHYPTGNVFNNQDVFYTSGNPGTTNVYAEILQLQDAGFTSVRSYQTEPYSWIDIINQAHALGMKVVYEANIPQTSDGFICAFSTITEIIPCAEAVLQSVIDNVTPAVFADTVTLVFAGHENYCGIGAPPPCPGTSTNINYLVGAVKALQTKLAANGLTTPVGSALVSGNLVTPPLNGDMNTLIASYSATAPLGYDPYPFQWGVPVANSVDSVGTTNSIAYDYSQVMAQSFYTSPRTIMMAETGWAGTNDPQPSYTYPAGYACYTPGPPTYGPCSPGIIGEATLYWPDIYTYVSNAANHAAVLAFEAYDEPAKGGGGYQ